MIETKQELREIVRNEIKKIKNEYMFTFAWHVSIDEYNIIVSAGYSLTLILDNGYTEIELGEIGIELARELIQSNAISFMETEHRGTVFVYRLNDKLLLGANK